MKHICLSVNINDILAMVHERAANQQLMEHILFWTPKAVLKRLSNRMQSVPTLTVASLDLLHKPSVSDVSAYAHLSDDAVQKVAGQIANRLAAILGNVA